MKNPMIYALVAVACAMSACACAATSTNDPTEPPTAPATAAHPASVWQAVPGQSLRQVAKTWASRAGYEVVWDAGFDYPVRASLRMDGDFINAITGLFDAYAAADRPLSVDIYKEQKLVHVQARGE
ncbi:toxin co-regulated pilus biosynthesis Q family protein [Luteibacter sp. SG786]|uniref:toxin co-regulated pilus biosynthesis Q family protein n=1 Tax=Luteibacter sp. SG786 TaxID=2587130 RepID=UPI001ABA467F|nr:toxin co-regulated pilus biosynthesis Q family protein [Luteibacter sp. SG786]NII55590.1 type IV pili sensor histidine kinase/response regulator [Luteibacter sp. SG786]